MSKFAQPLLPLLLIMIEVKGLGRREKGKKDEDKGEMKNGREGGYNVSTVNCISRLRARVSAFDVQRD